MVQSPGVTALCDMEALLLLERAVLLTLLVNLQLRLN